MNREDIIRMAQEAGWDAHHAEFDTRIQNFAALVASAEREACAKICVDESWRLKKIAFEHENLQANSAAIRASILAEMIRARGQA